MICKEHVTMDETQASVSNHFVENENNVSKNSLDRKSKRLTQSDSGKGASLGCLESDEEANSPKEHLNSVTSQTLTPSDSGKGASPGCLGSDEEANSPTERLNSVTSQTLTPSDSGKGESPGCLEFDEEANSPKERLNSVTSDLNKELVNISSDGHGTDKSLMDREGKYPDPQRVVSDAQTHPGSGIETPLSASHFPFSPLNFETEVLTHLIDLKQEVHSQPCTSLKENDIVNISEVKRMTLVANKYNSETYCGNTEVNCLQDVGRVKGQAVKTSRHAVLSRLGSVDDSWPVLHSFLTDDHKTASFVEFTNQTTSYMPSPDRSTEISRHSHQTSRLDFAKIINTIEEDDVFENNDNNNNSKATNNTSTDTPSSHGPSVSPLQNGHTTLNLPSPVTRPKAAASVNSAHISNFALPHHGMVSKIMMDQLSKELSNSQHKLAESRGENKYFSMFLTLSERQEVLRRDLENKQRELDTRQHGLDARQLEIDAKLREIDAKQREIDAKQQELDAKQRELEAKQREVDANQRDRDQEPKEPEEQAGNGKKTVEEEVKQREQQSKQLKLEVKQQKLEDKQLKLDVEQMKFDVKQLKLKIEQRKWEAKQQKINAKQQKINAKQRKLEKTELSIDTKEQLTSSFIDECNELDTSKEEELRRQWINEGLHASDCCADSENVNQLAAEASDPLQDPNQTLPKQVLNIRPLE